MKKLTQKNKLRQIRLSRYALILLRKQHTSRHPKNSNFSRGSHSGKLKKCRIEAPEYFDLREAEKRDILLTFIDDVSIALKSGCLVTLGFDNTKALLPCGTLVFSAHLDIWSNNFVGQLNATYPTDDVVEQLFQHIGVLSTLGLENRKSITHEKVKFWHYHSGVSAKAAEYKPLTQSVIDHIEHPAKQLFADCLNEAVSNTVHHAYEFESLGMPPVDQQKWWMFSESKDDHLFIAIYDAGVSIPGHLSKKPELRDFLRMHRNKATKDAYLIEVAVNSPRTSTKLYNRGKGLPEMLEFSMQINDGGLTILSRHGGFMHGSSNQSTKRLKFSRPLTGTLVLWRIPLSRGHSDE